MTGTTATRALIEEFFAQLAAGDKLGIASCFSDAGEFKPPLSMPFDSVRGRSEIAQFLTAAGLSDVFLAGSLNLDVHTIIANGEHGVALATMTAQTQDGRDYTNDYCWHFRCSADGIERVVEYVDTLHASRVLSLGGGSQ